MYTKWIIQAILGAFWYITIVVPGIVLLGGYATTSTVSVGLNFSSMETAVGSLVAGVALYILLGVFLYYVIGIPNKFANFIVRSAQLYPEREYLPSITSPIEKYLANTWDNLTSKNQSNSGVGVDLK